MTATRRRHSRQRDFVDEIIAERSERNPEFPRLVEGAVAELAHRQRVRKRLPLLRGSQQQRRVAYDSLLLDEEAEEALQRRRPFRVNHKTLAITPLRSLRGGEQSPSKAANRLATRETICDDVVMPGNIDDMNARIRRRGHPVPQTGQREPDPAERIDYGAGPRAISLPADTTAQMSGARTAISAWTTSSTGRLGHCGHRARTSTDARGVMSRVGPSTSRRGSPCDAPRMLTNTLTTPESVYSAENEKP